MSLNLNDNARGGSFCMLNPGVILDASAKADLEITGAITYVIDGKYYAYADTDSGILLDDTANTIADGYSRLYLSYLNAAGTITTIFSDSKQNTKITSGEEALDWPRLPVDSAPVCGVLVTNSTGSLFTAGTTTLDTTSIFCDIYDLFAIPTEPIVAISSTQDT